MLRVRKTSEPHLATPGMGRERRLSPVWHGSDCTEDGGTTQLWGHGWVNGCPQYMGRHSGGEEGWGLHTNCGVALSSSSQ